MREVTCAASGSSSTTKTIPAPGGACKGLDDTIVFAPPWAARRDNPGELEQLVSLFIEERTANGVQQNATNGCLDET
jgi:hypothetical protein